MDNYQLFEEIARGRYSTVYKGREKKTVRYVAIKSIDKQRLGRVRPAPRAGAPPLPHPRATQVRTEVAILHKMSHPNVVGFVNWYESRNHLWMIVEYCAGGSLRELLATDGPVPEHLIVTMGVDIMAGMAYLHSRSCLLRDVKPKNFLLTEYGAVKVRTAAPPARNGHLTP